MRLLSPALVFGRQGTELTGDRCLKEVSLQHPKVLRLRIPRCAARAGDGEELAQLPVGGPKRAFHGHPSAAMLNSCRLNEARMGLGRPWNQNYLLNGQNTLDARYKKYLSGHVRPDLSPPCNFLLSADNNKQHTDTQTHRHTDTQTHRHTDT